MIPRTGLCCFTELSQSCLYTHLPTQHTRGQGSKVKGWAKVESYWCRIPNGLLCIERWSRGEDLEKEFGSDFHWLCDVW